MIRPPPLSYARGLPPHSRIKRSIIIIATTIETVTLSQNSLYPDVVAVDLRD
jgi:hypothetical protein